MQGVTVFDDRNGNGQQDAGEAVTASGQDGAYTLNNVPGGSANIREVVPGGFRCTAPAGCAFSISLNVGDHLTGKDFGNTPVAAAVAAARCIDLRRFKFKVHHGPRSRVVKVQVFVDGKRVQQFKGRNLKAVTIEKFPQEFHAVRILVTLSNGSTRTSRRVYLECTKGKPKVVSHHHRRKPTSKKSPS
jgi:hypothetical protein